MIRKLLFILIIFCLSATAYATYLNPVAAITVSSPTGYGPQTLTLNASTSADGDIFGDEPDIRYYGFDFIYNSGQDCLEQFEVANTCDSTFDGITTTSYGPCNNTTNGPGSYQASVLVVDNDSGNDSAQSATFTVYSRIPITASNFRRR